MEIVFLVQALDDNKFLHEATWLIVVRLAFAAMSLVVFVLGNKEGPTAEETNAAAKRAQKLLGKLGKNSPAAQRCYESLNVCILGPGAVGSMFNSF